MTFAPTALVVGELTADGELTTAGLAAAAGGALWVVLVLTTGELAGGEPDGAALVGAVVGLGVDPLPQAASNAMPAPEKRSRSICLRAIPSPMRPVTLLCSI